MGVWRRDGEPDGVAGVVGVLGGELARRGDGEGGGRGMDARRELAMVVNATLTPRVPYVIVRTRDVMPIVTNN